MGLPSGVQFVVSGAFRIHMALLISRVGAPDNLLVGTNPQLSVMSTLVGALPFVARGEAIILVGPLFETDPYFRFWWFATSPFGPQ